MDDDHEFALEISVQNIDDTNESDEELDQLSAISDFSERFNEDGDTQSNGGSSYHHSLARHQAAVPSVSLKSILEDERSFMLFRRFVKDGCISRNLQFWLACEHFRCQSHDIVKLAESATAIYKKFLGSSAPLHISVLDGTKKKIQLNIQLKTELDNHLFVQAQSEVYHQMECNELRQFLLSDSFSDCSQFNPDSSSAYYNGVGLESFQPATYRGGSLHSGSDDSTSVTSFNSDSMSGTVLCAPRHTRPHLLQSPRNAHSDTEHYNSTNARHLGMSSQTFFSRGKSLTSREFYEILYERLVAVDKDRANLQRRARNIARENGKSYESIMSLDWFDAPEAIKYIQFEEGATTAIATTNLKSSESPLPTAVVQQQSQSNVGVSHIASMAAKEIQEALKDMEITRQVRQKRSIRTASAMSTSSSSYISDSGVGDSYLPSSGGGSGPQPRSPWVQAYVQNQHRVTSQLSDREQKAHLAATLLINNSTHHEDLNPNGRRGHYRNYPGAYSSDDSSSCFTTTSHSSNSEFFIPRRPTHSIYTDSDDTRQHSRYPQGMRKVGHKRHTSSQQTPRYYPPHQQPSPHPSPSSQLVPPPPAPPQQQQTFTRDMSPAMHTPTIPPKGGDSLLVAYTLEGFGSTIAKRLPSSQLLTLSDFKEKVLQRKAPYRFFFKTFCEDLNQEVMEELSDDNSPLPQFEGKIIAHVEKAEPES